MSASGLKQRPKSGPIDSTGTPSSVPTGFNEAVLYNLPTDLGQAVAGINGWVVIEDLLIKSLELPEIDTRRGLNAIHKNFKKFSRKLEDVYNRYLLNDKIAAGVVGIYTQMCADAKLKDRLIEECNLMSKVFSLIERPGVRLEAIQCLTEVTHYQEMDVRMETCKKMPVLMWILGQHPMDPLIAELTLATILHSAAVVLKTDKTPDQQLFKLFDVPRLIRFFISHMKGRNATDPLIVHASQFFIYSPRKCSKEIQANSSAMNFLVALVRSDDLRMRLSGILGLMRAYTNDE